MNNNTKIKNLNKRLDDLQKKVSSLPTKIPRPISGTNRLSSAVTTKKNNSVPASSIPSWKSTGRGIRIAQSERVATIRSGDLDNEFNCTRYVINPANNTTFPWLAGIASLFDKYKFHKLRFIFSNNAGTSVSGQVSLGIDFDTLDDPPEDGVGMSNLTKVSQFAPWKTESVDVPVNRRGNNVWLYCEDLNAELNENIDLKMYHLGSLFVSTEGMTANSVAGYLHVEYDVELIDKNPRGSNDNIITRSSTFTSGLYSTYSSGSEVTVAKDAMPVNTIGPAFTLASRKISGSSLGMDVTCPRGKYFMNVVVTVVFKRSSSSDPFVDPELYHVSATSQYLEKFTIVEGTDSIIGSGSGDYLAAGVVCERTYSALYELEFSANGSVTLVAGSVNHASGAGVTPDSLVASITFTKKRETV